MPRTATLLLLALAFAAGAADSLASADPAHKQRMTKTGPHKVRPQVQAEPGTLQWHALEAGRLAEKNELAGAEREMRKVLEHADFATLTPPQQRAVVSALANLARERGDPEAAHALFVRATAGDDTTAQDWIDRAWVASGLNDHEDLARSVAGLARHWPDELPDLEIFLIHDAIENLRLDSEARYDMLSALAERNYAPQHLGEASFVSYELAVMQIERGETEAARATVARISHPEDVARVLVDRRFDRVLDPAAPLSAEDSALRLVADLRARAIVDPDILKIQSELAQAMLIAGQNEDVVALADEIAVAFAETTASGPSPYQDAADYRNWVMNYRAVALRRLGRTDEAATELEHASALKEFGSVNISQVINLGHLYCSLGQPDRALTAITRVGDDISNYGRTVLAAVELRAGLQKDDAAATTSALGRMRANRIGSPLVYVEGLVLTGDLDAAAAELIALLDSPKRRGMALLYLQTGREPPELPAEREGNARWDALLAREDLLAAVDRVGRIRSFDLYLGF